MNTRLYFLARYSSEDCDVCVCVCVLISFFLIGDQLLQDLPN